MAVILPPFLAAYLWGIYKRTAAKLEEVISKHVLFNRLVNDPLHRMPKVQR
jgi:hypothetical protein